MARKRILKALNLGCGEDPKGRGFIPDHLQIVNHDRLAHCSWVDVAHDLREIPWPWEDCEFLFILAFDVVGHLPDTVAFMDECWRILSPGGTLLLHTCNIKHLEQAWRNPTVCKVFAPDSFAFFDPETNWGRQYIRQITDKYWKHEKVEAHGLELFVTLTKREIVNAAERAANVTASMSPEMAEEIIAGPQLPTRKPKAA